MRGSKVKALRRWWVKQVTDLKIPPGGASWRATKWLVDRCGWPKGAARQKTASKELWTDKRRIQRGDWKVTFRGLEVAPVSIQRDFPKDLLKNTPEINE